MSITEQSYKRAVNFLLVQVVYFSLDSGLDVLCGSVLYKCRFYSHTPPQDFEVFGGLDKVRIGEENQAYREEQFHGLGLRGCDMVGTPP